MSALATAFRFSLNIIFGIGSVREKDALNYYFMCKKSNPNSNMTSHIVNIAKYILFAVFVSPLFKEIIF